MRRALPSLNALHSFEVAARHLSFTRAAAELNVTQGAVSRLVRQLEDQLGIRLFIRTKQGLQLTPEGAAYWPRLRSAFDGIEAATRELRNHSRGGVLSIRLFPTFAMRWLLPRLHDFQTAHPDILVDVSTDHIIRDLAVENVDTGVVVHEGLPPLPGHAAELLMGEDMVLACTPELARQLRKADDLRKAVLLQITTRPDGWTGLLEQLGLTDVDPRRGPGFEHFFLLIQAALNGSGIALLPRFFVEAELAEGRLVELFGLRYPSQQSYWLIYPKDRAELPRVRAFKTWIMAQAACE